MKRRNPKQKRAKDTVEEIIRASARIINTEGMGAFTTNRIAREAGVGVGSVYDYFSDKEEIVLVVLERELADITAAIEAEIQELVLLDTPAAADRIIRFVLGMAEDKAELIRALAGQMYSTVDFPPVIRFAAQAEALVRLLITQRVDRSQKEIGMAAFLITHAITGICTGVANGLPPGQATDDAVKLIRDAVLLWMEPAYAR